MSWPVTDLYWIGSCQAVDRFYRRVIQWRPLFSSLQKKNVMSSTEKRKSKIFVSQKREQKLLVYVIVPDKCLSENLSIQEIDAFLLRIAAEVSYCILYGIIRCFFPILSRCQILQLYNNMYKQRMRGQQLATNNTLKRQGTVWVK